MARDCARPEASSNRTSRFLVNTLQRRLGELPTLFQGLAGFGGAHIAPLLQERNKRTMVLKIGCAARPPSRALRHSMLETGEHMALDAPEISPKLAET